MIRTPTKDNLPPEGENRQKRHNDEMSFQTLRSVMLSAEAGNTAAVVNEQLNDFKKRQISIGNK
jgi:hypothetical protein